MSKKMTQTIALLLVSILASVGLVYNLVAY